MNSYIIGIESLLPFSILNPHFMLLLILFLVFLLYELYFEFFNINIVLNLGNFVSKLFPSIFLKFNFVK